MQDEIVRRFRDVAPAADFVSLRYHREDRETLRVRKNVVEPVEMIFDSGAMVTVIAKGGMGYAATADLSRAGLREACERAMNWAEQSAARSVVDFSSVPYAAETGEYASVVRTPWETVPLPEKLRFLQDVSARLKCAEEIVNWSAELNFAHVKSRYVSMDGGDVYQEQQLLMPDMSATANAGNETQTRSLGSMGHCRQGGWEVLEELDLVGRSREVAEEAIGLLYAPNCPTGIRDLLLSPDQMHLQLHESIGHPLELDRILGDERNFAGTSFVTLDMVGHFRYGSSLLNVTFDPSLAGELASFAFDDEGTPAQKAYLIEDGILKRTLGGTLSQHRAGAAGVANSRACSWNRPPIDRMANLNIEPGASRFDEMVGQVERGIWMRSNRSWSIDDSRNKFQFGCEWGQLIEDGKLTTLVKNPNYRGISSAFWRNLKAVGDRDTFEVMGAPTCGKGEPNQIIRVGHATPVCLFADVEVFGGEDSSGPTEMGLDEA